MKPVIERIALADPDPTLSGHVSTKLATHICRLTGSLISHDDQDTFEAIFDEKGVEILRDKAAQILSALGVEVMEDRVAKLTKEFEAASAAAFADAAKLDTEKRGDEAQALRDRVAAGREDLDKFIAEMDPEAFASDLIHEIDQHIAQPLIP